MGELSSEVTDQLNFVEGSLAQAATLIKQLDDVDYNELRENVGSTDKAKYDLSLVYALNSLFWMYIRSQGGDPQQHGIKSELDRVKVQMKRLKEISDKSKMPRINKDAARRFVRHELWEPKKSVAKKNRTNENESWEK